jgi:CHAT domain-containing protein
MAASFGDLLRALNEYQPNVVHFSGHGGAGSLSFDSEDDLATGSNQLDFSVINDVISAIDNPPVMLVFNACDTLTGAEVFTDTVSAVLAMSGSIGDLAAVVFAPAFYAALSAGQSVKSALAQGKAMLKAQAVGDEDLPTLLLKAGVEATKLKLV